MHSFEAGYIMDAAYSYTCFLCVLLICYAEKQLTVIFFESSDIRDSSDSCANSANIDSRVCKDNSSEIIHQVKATVRTILTVVTEVRVVIVIAHSNGVTVITVQTVP